MHDKKKRLGWSVLAVALPGPWTPVIVLAYLLGRVIERDQDTEQPLAAEPDPYACAYGATTWDRTRRHGGPGARDVDQDRLLHRGAVPMPSGSDRCQARPTRERARRAAGTAGADHD
ncbi:hypothetical protein [Amycolatopsis taiwanensis]|uniref:hypothetical protein n=1 Tax=Amycolatopsis taiwanensis TaxID=342230 RepID=UPI00255253BD|nr:hypothetical protein [Amycolatopsis taiwanensis]